MTPLSIQTRLVLLLNLLVVALLSLTGYISYQQSLHEIDEVFDAQLAQSSRLTAGLLQTNPALLQQSEPLLIPVAALDELVKHQAELSERFLTGYKYESNIAIQIWHDDKHLLLHTANLAMPMRPIRKTGYSEYRTVDGDLWINFTLRLEELDVQIVSSQREAVREELSYHIAVTQIQPILFLIIPLSILTLLIIRRGLKPLKRLQQQLSHTKPEQLAPITTPMPIELQQVVTAINQLLGAINQHMEREKRFVADASHELRTPLAIIRLHAQNLANTPLNTEQQAAVAAIEDGTVRMTHLANQLLALAKLDNPKLSLSAVNLQALLHSSLEQITPELLQKVVWVLPTEPENSAALSASLQADLPLLQVALRNLLENAAKYAPVDSHVSIQLGIQAQQLSLSICNPYIAQPNKALLGQRFYRAAAHQHIAGAGLGLSIVSRILELHHFSHEISLSDNTYCYHIKMPLG